MEKVVDHPAVDGTPERARPALALALALLSIPGSTLAWEFPYGGLWIGLPLGVAAILLAIRARRELGRSRMAGAAIAIAVLAVGLMGVSLIVSLF
jgi:hypothetical protein